MQLVRIAIVSLNLLESQPDGRDSPSPAAAHADAESPESSDADPVWIIARRVARLMELEQYDAALALLEEHERSNPDPALLFMRATVEERRGRCDRATPLYEAFSRATESEEDKLAASQGMDRCRETLGQRVPPPAPPTAGRTPSPTASAASNDPSSNPSAPRLRPWYRDPAGLSLISSGAAAVGIGAGLWIRAALDSRQAQGTDELGEYRRLRRRSSRLQPAGLAILSTGAVLVFSGAIRLAVMAGRNKRTSRARIRARLGGVEMRF